PISKNGRCGSAFGGQICQGSTYGDCCSQYNWCGRTSDHCKASFGCQSSFGACTG
ncbi:carbohydrate-binding module family 18 protein, partial [Plenodomus tracheiphilus IPT5]